MPLPCFWRHVLMGGVGGGDNFEGYLNAETGGI